MAAEQTKVTAARSWDGHSVAAEGVVADRDLRPAGFFSAEASMDELTQLVAWTPSAYEKGTIEIRIR